MKLMNIGVLVIFSLLLLVPVSGNAANDRSRILEDGREVTVEMLTLPPRGNGILAIQGCSSCKRIALTAGPSTRYFIAKREVAFPDFERHLRANPKVSVLVVSPRLKNTVIRVVANEAVAAR